jgi:hypothetical protein
MDDSEYESWLGYEIFLSSKSFRLDLLFTKPSPSLAFSWYWASFPLVKRPGHEVDHSLPSIAKVQNVWSYTSNSPVYCVADRENVNFNAYSQHKHHKETSIYYKRMMI